MHVEIEPISTRQRKTETEIDALFADHRAAIFTGLLDLFAQALEILPTIQIEHLPRMADFAMLGAAVYAARGVENSTQAFMDDYNGMRKESIHRTLESSPIAGAIQAYLERHPFGTEFFSGKLAMEALQPFRNDGDAWPKSPKGFADAIRRLSPALRVIGIRAEVGKTRNMHGYPVMIKPIEKTANVLDVLHVRENKFFDAKKESAPENEVHGQNAEVLL